MKQKAQVLQVRINEEVLSVFLKLVTEGMWITVGLYELAPK